MNLANVYTFLFVTLGFVIAFVAYWLMSAGLFPRFVEQSAERFGRMPFRATLLGAVVGLPLIIGGLKLSSTGSNGLVKLLALVVALIPLLLALFGSAGLALRIGRGLKSERDEREPWRSVLRGGLVLALSFVLPVIGWFGVLPFVFLGGFGMCLLALVQGRPLRAASPVSAALRTAPPELPGTVEAASAAVS